MTRGDQSPVYSLVYTSIAREPYDAEALAALLEQSRVNNAKADVTGMLLYKAGQFIQLLEGEKGDVERTFARIYQDRRHEQVHVVREGFVEERTDLADTPTQAMRLLTLFREKVY